MKLIWRYFNDFHRHYFEPRLYVVFLLYVAALITVNYSLDLEDSVIDRLPAIWKLAAFTGFHLFSYLGVLLIAMRFSKEKNWLSLWFLLKVIMGFLILGCDRSFYTLFYDAMTAIAPAEVTLFFQKLSINSTGILLILLPLISMHLIYDHGSNHGLYGLRVSGVNWNLYFFMWLVMIPVVWAATYLPGFTEYYPTWKRAGGLEFASFYNVGIWIPAIIYETFYIGDFLFTELFFRGFLVIGLSKYLGRNAVLPMAATYAVLHFGKPLGETISSVFGGYLLGILALYTRNIWGGVFVHGGTAALMELFAWLRQ